MMLFAPSTVIQLPEIARARPVSAVAVPSGQPLELYEVLTDQVGADQWMRFRFLAPAIGKKPAGMEFADVESDFEYLCSTVALPYLQELDATVDIVAVSLMSRAVSFGVSDPDVTQFVEVFRVASGACEWEGF